MSAPDDVRRCAECGDPLPEDYAGERCGKCLDAAEDREPRPPVWRTTP